MTNPIRVLIADDHSIVREGLKTVLEDGEFTVVGEASNGFMAVDTVRDTHPDVVLMDLQMPGLSGIEAARMILAEFPRTKILALTTFADEKLVMECLRAGVHGYVIKDVEKMGLKQYIRGVLKGEAVIDPKVTGVLMARVRSGPANNGRPEVPISPQQLAIVRLVAQGHSNREIAEKLNLCENTVKGHVAEILHRLGVKNRVEAALQASARGWV